MKLGEIIFLNTKKKLTTPRVIFFASDTHPYKNNKEPQALFVQLKIKEKDKTIVAVDNVDGVERIYYAGLGEAKEITQRVLQDVVANVVRAAHSRKTKEIVIDYPNNLKLDPHTVGVAIGLGLLLGNYRFTKFMSKKDELEKDYVQKFQIDISELSQEKQAQVREGVDHAGVLAAGISLTRDLINEPAGHIQPKTLAQVATEIAERSKQIECRVLSKSDCEKQGMGAYLGVAQGSDASPQFIILHYTPSSSQKKSNDVIGLVGKSITFDSGGLSLKPAEAMEDMKIDMSGGATVLGIFSALAKFQVPIEVYGVLPACENMPSGKAMRPGDVVTAMNGKSIEVLNTDAEGRLALADALVYTEKKLGATHIIDLATLTGACMVALGPDIAGVFGNTENWTNMFVDAANRHGDEAASLPLYKKYMKKMKGSISDLKNIGGGRYGGAITAALFLNEFVEKATWIHVDIAGPAYRSDESDGLLGKGGTGWGILTIIDLLTHWKDSKAS